MCFTRRDEIFWKWEKISEVRQRERFKKSTGTRILKVMMSVTCFKIKGKLYTKQNWSRADHC